MTDTKLCYTFIMESTVGTLYTFDQIDPRIRRVTRGLINAVIERVIQSLAPQRIILFGSCARGSAKHDSDIDLLVQIDDHHPLARQKRRDRSGRVLKLFPYRSFGLDTIVLTENELQALLAANEGEWDLMLEILAEGKVMYERPEKAPPE